METHDSVVHRVTLDEMDDTSRRTMLEALRERRTAIVVRVRKARDKVAGTFKEGSTLRKSSEKTLAKLDKMLEAVDLKLIEADRILREDFDE